MWVKPLHPIVLRGCSHYPCCRLTSDLAATRSEKRSPKFLREDIKGPSYDDSQNFGDLFLLRVVAKHEKLTECRSGSVSALPRERPGFGPRSRLREIIPANNCTMQGQNNWGNWGSLGVMKLWVAWEVLRWLMKFRELCSGGFHPKLVTPPYHGFLNVNTPPNSQNSKRH